MTPTKPGSIWNLPSLYDMFEGEPFFHSFFNKGNQLNLPALNIKEAENNYEVEMAIPGMKREDISIEMTNNLITVTGEKKEEKEEKEQKYHRKEFSYDSFSRSIAIPEHVDTDRIEASFTDGVLKLHIPKKAQKQSETQSKKISIA